MQIFITANKLKVLRGKESGVSLIETLIALVILGIVAVIFLGSLSTAFTGVTIIQERVAAESLAKSQMEYIKVQDFIAVADYNPGDPAKHYQLIDIPQDLADRGYDIAINPPEIVVVPDGWGEVQTVAVVISHNGEDISTVTDYRLGGLS